jgi:hypothetical protein
MSRSVLIIELEQKNHLSLVAGLIDFFYHEDFVIYTALKPEFYEELFHRRSFNMDYIGCPVNVNLRQLFYTVKFDIIILCSAYEINLRYLFLIMRSRRITLVLHNINAYFRFNFSSIKYFLKSLYRNFLRRYSYKFIVMNPVLRMYLMESFKVDSEKCAWFPFKQINCDLKYRSVFGQVTPRIVFPGAIDFNKRYYDDFVKLASVYSGVEFVVLGTFATSKDRVLFLKLLDNFRPLTNLVFFDRRLSESELSDYLVNCSFIYSFLRVNYCFNEYSELYGISKETGVLYDALTNQKILLINKDFLFPEKLKRLIRTFSNFSDQFDYIKLLLEDRFSTFNVMEDIRSYYSEVDLRKYI